MRRSGPLHKALAIGKLHYFAGENDVLDRAPRLHRHRPCRVAAARARPAHVLAFDLAAADELRGEFRGAAIVAEPRPEHQQAAAILDDRLGALAVNLLELRIGLRSEEHTSEIQTLMRPSYAGCC